MVGRVREARKRLSTLARHMHDMLAGRLALLPNFCRRHPRSGARRRRLHVWSAADCAAAKIRMTRALTYRKGERSSRSIAVRRLQFTVDLGCPKSDSSACGVPHAGPLARGFARMDGARAAKQTCASPSSGLARHASSCASSLLLSAPVSLLRCGLTGHSCTLRPPTVVRALR
jgi:hypothetical protein